MRCFVCDKVGHKSVDCRARTQPNTIVRSERGIRCYICSAFGHKAENCPESKKGGVQIVVAMTVIPEEVSKTNEVETEIRPNHEHSWDGKEQVKLACGCIMPVVAGAHTVGNNVQFTHQGMAPICRGRINDVDVMRDSGSISFVVRTDLVHETQKTGTTSVRMLIDGTVKRYPTAIVEQDTTYLSGRVQALYKDDPVHDVIIGNIPGAKDPQLNCESSTPMTIVPDIETPYTDRVTEEEAHESENKVIGGAEYTSADMSQTDGKCKYGAAVHTRAKSEEVNQKKKELKVVHVPGTEVTTKELIELQKADETIEKYWDLSKQPGNVNKKVSFIEKKGILYSDKRGDGSRLQLVVPEKLRQRVLSMATIHS